MKNEKSIVTCPQSHTQWGSYAPYLKPIKLQYIMVKNKGNSPYINKPI